MKDKFLFVVVNQNWPRLYSLWMMISVLLSTNTYAETLGVSYKTHPIVGFHPHMVSIGAQIDKQGNSLFDLSGNPILTVGSRIFINSQYCNMALNDPQFTEVSPELVAFFDYQDIDGDNCFGNLSQLNWYILDSIEQDWNNIDSWEQLDVIEITNEQFPGSIIENVGGGGVALKIPVEAEGKRIGFTYQPYSKTGSPQHGIPLYVWDLNYFFGQNAPNDVGISNVIHEEFKLDEIEKNLNPAGGIVSALPPKPLITNMMISGIFAPASHLTLEYDFIQPDGVTYEDISRFWWGEKDTTAQQAEENSELGSKVPESPVLSEQDIAKILEVSILPIGRSNQFIIHGDVVTHTIEDEGNNIQFLPIVTDLTFIYDETESSLEPEHGLNIGSNIAASYRFIATSPTQLDRSTYSWFRNGEAIEDAFGNTIPADQINEFAMVPAYTIADKDSGAVLSLKVTATDDHGLVGNSVIIDSSIVVTLSLPTLTNLKFSQSERFYVGDKISALYVFSPGNSEHEDVQIDKSEYEWKIGNDLFSGVVAVTGTVPEVLLLEDHIGKSVELTVTPVNGADLRGDKQYIKSSQTIASPVPSISGLNLTGDLILMKEISASYSFNAGKGASDRSTYNWTRNGTNVSSGTVQNSNKPTYVIKLADIGTRIGLNITPKNELGDTGTMRSAQTGIIPQPPAIDNIRVFRNAVILQDSDVIRGGDLMTAEYTFVPATNEVDNSTYSWGYNYIVLVYGNTIPGNDRIGTVPGFYITQSHVGLTLTLQLVPKGGNGLIGIDQRITLPSAVVP